MKTKAPAYPGLCRIPPWEYIFINRARLILFLFVALSITAFGCKKDAQQYLRFKLDGVAIECNENLNAGGNDGTLLYISGGYDNIDLELRIIEVENLAPGRYLFTADKYRRAFLWIDGIKHYAGDDGWFSVLVGSGEITIAEISNNAVKGTFHFTTDSTSYSSPSKYITDGEFDLKFDQ